MAAWQNEQPGADHLLDNVNKKGAPKKGARLELVFHRITGNDVPYLFPFILFYCIVLVIIYSIFPLSSIFVRVSNDFGEGWNAYWAQAVQKGSPLYVQDRMFTANNYPPLSFYVNALAGKAIGDNIFAGRIIALVSMIGVAGLIGWFVRKLGAPLRWVLLSVMIFLLYNLVYLRQMVAVDNPQWLGEMVGLMSLLPLVGRPPSELRAGPVIAAAGLMVTAGLIKHNQFALPIAISSWLLIYNRKAFLFWCLAGFVFAASACLILFDIYGSAVFVEIMYYKRTTSVPNFVSGLIKTCSFACLIGVATLSLHWQRSNEQLTLFLHYAAFGVIFAIIQRFGSGVYVNAYDDAVIGLVLVCGSFLGCAANGLHERGLGPWSRLVLLLVVLTPLIITTPKNVKRSIADTSAIPRQQAIWAAMIKEVRRAPDPAICELLSVCYWAGKPLEIDFFAYGQRLRTGTSVVELAETIEAREAAVLVIDRTDGVSSDQQRLPPPLPALIERNYGVTRIASNGVATMHRLSR